MVVRSETRLARDNALNTGSVSQRHGVVPINVAVLEGSQLQSRVCMPGADITIAKTSRPTKAKRCS
jgi:hypothetical protein